MLCNLIESLLDSPVFFPSIWRIKKFSYSLQLIDIWHILNKPNYLCCLLFYRVKEQIFT